MKSHESSQSRGGCRVVANHPNHRLANPAVAANLRRSATMKARASLPREVCDPAWAIGPLTHTQSLVLAQVKAMIERYHDWRPGRGLGRWQMACGSGAFASL